MVGSEHNFFASPQGIPPQLTKVQNLPKPLLEVLIEKQQAHVVKEARHVEVVRGDRSGGLSEPPEMLPQQPDASGMGPQFAMIQSAVFGGKCLDDC